MGGAFVGKQSEGSSDTAVAMRAASRVAAGRPRHGDRDRITRKRSGSLVLTAVVVVATLIGMLVLMLKVGS